MTTDNDSKAEALRIGRDPAGSVKQAGARSRKNLPEHARRALAEADARRKVYLQREAEMPGEVGGRGGKEPVRYGDWEVKGIASDF